MKNRILQHKPIAYRLALSALFFNQGVIFASWASRIADIKTKLNLSEADLGSILFALPIGQLITMWISGMLVTKCGSKKMITISCIIYPIALVALSFVNTPIQLFVGLVLMGMAANLGNISLNTQAVSVENIYGRSIMSSFHGLWSLAGFCGGIFSTLLASVGIGIFANFFGTLVFSYVLMFITRRFILPFDVSKSDTDTSTKTRGMFSPTPFIVFLGAIAFGCMSCEGMMFDWSVVYFKEVLSAPVEKMRLGYIAFMGTMALGRFVADRLIMRFGMAKILQASGVLVFVGMMISVVFPSVLWSSLGFMLVGAGVSSVVPICFSLAGRSRRMPAGIAIATVSTIGFFGFLICPPIIGFIAELSSLRVSFAILACFGLLITAVVPIIKSRI